MNVLLTGGCGFIGSNLIRLLLAERPEWKVVNLDKLTYAGNLENLADLESRYRFVHGDICDEDAVRGALSENRIDTIVHFAAESHVDRSILGSMVFTRTNVLGTHVLVEEAKNAGVRRFVHVSTDEVYGSLGPEGSFAEDSPLDPTSPYAASKAATDLLSYQQTRHPGLDVVIVRPFNHIGPRQMPLYAVPRFASQLAAIQLGRQPPVVETGDLSARRDLTDVRDMVRAYILLLEKGRTGEAYNAGSGAEPEAVTVKVAV